MYKFPGFSITERPVRAYPFHSAANVLGYLGEVDTSFLRRHAGEGYEPGDYSGMTGLERSYEKVLMGQRGIEFWKRDNKNRLTERMENGKLLKEIFWKKRTIYLNLLKKRLLKFKKDHLE